MYSPPTILLTECPVLLVLSLSVSFIDIICIVRPIPGETPAHPKSYRVQVAVKEGIRNFSPLHFPTILQRDDASRDLFLLKCKCDNEHELSSSLASQVGGGYKHEKAVIVLVVVVDVGV